VVALGGVVVDGFGFGSSYRSKRRCGCELNLTSAYRKYRPTETDVVFSLSALMDSIAWLLSVRSAGATQSPVTVGAAVQNIESRHAHRFSTPTRAVTDGGRS
jgi:hypothetical protein